MKKQLSYFSICIAFFLSSCLAEQTNPLVLGETCTDGIQNQDEEGIDCGGSCTPCDVIEDVVAPCKSSLTDNVLTLDGDDILLSTDDYGCYQESEYFKLYILDNTKEIIIEIYETTLPQVSTRYPIVHWFSSEPGAASVRITDFYSYVASSGDLYLSYDDGLWIVELCSVDLVRPEHTFTLSGRVLCDW